MQSKTYLPPIKYLLDSPIDDASSFNFPSIQQQSSLINNYNNNNNNNGNGNNNNNAYISSYLPSINESSQIYKRLMNSNDIHRHPNNNNSCSSSHASIKSLLSPPESPDMTTSHQQSLFNNYASHNHHNNYNHHSQPQSQQIVNHPCSCCIKPSSPTLPFIYSSQSSSRYVPYHYQYSQDSHNHHNHHHQQQQQQQRYHNSFPSTIQPIPISPFDHRKQLSISTSPTSTSTSSLILQPNLPRISTISSNLTSTPTTKHFTPKSLHPLSCSPTTSSNCNGNRYQCQYCSKRFSRPSSLRIHTYSHTGEKPFVCSEPGCGRKFSVQSNMRRHLRVHKLGRPVKKTRYDGEVEGVKMLSPAKITRNYL